jgi:acyl-CoA synthetase (AMP-forming)/AMP-acid ligase II
MPTCPRRAEYREAAPDCPAVVIYTSGSTGKPKGILHDQASVGGAVLRNHSVFHPTPDDVEGLVAPFTFIAGYALTMHPLCAGGCLTIIPREVIVDPIRLADFIELTNKKSSYLQEKDRRKDKYSKQTTAQGWPVNWASSTVIPPHQGHCGYAVPSASLTRRAASTTGQSRGCMATHVNQNCRIQSLVGPKVLVL